MRHKDLTTGLPFISQRLWPDRRLYEGRSALVGLAASLGTFVILYISIKEHAVAGVLVPLGVFVGLLVLAATWRDWEFGVKALSVVIIFEGAFRKWLLPSFSEGVYVYKDFLVVVIYISYLMRRDKAPLLIKADLKFFHWSLIAFALYAFASVMNSRSPHPVVGLFGVKAYCLYIPLAFVLPRMFTSREKLTHFLTWYVLLSLPVLALGAVQFIDSDPSSALNKYAWTEEQIRNALGDNMVIAGFEDSAGKFYVRITGTFSYITGLTAFLPVIFALLLSLVSLGSTKRLSVGIRSTYYVAIAGVVAMTMMTGSRATVITICFIALLFYCLTALKSLIHRTPQLLVIALISWVTLTAFFPQALDAFYTRSFGGEDQIVEGSGRIAEAVRLPIDEGIHAGPFGFGIGATQNSVPAMMGSLKLPFLGEPIDFPGGAEAELPRVMLELGVVGYFIYLLLRYSLLLVAWRTYKQISDRESKNLAAALIAALVLPLIFGGAIIVHTQNVYQWLLLGMLLSLLNAEKLAQRQTFARNSSQLVP